MSDFNKLENAIDYYAKNPCRVLGIPTTYNKNQIFEAHQDLEGLIYLNITESYEANIIYEQLKPINYSLAILKKAYNDIFLVDSKVFAFSDSKYAKSFSQKEIFYLIDHITCYDELLACYLWAIINDYEFNYQDLWYKLCVFIDNLRSLKNEQIPKYLDRRFSSKVLEETPGIIFKFYNVFKNLIVAPLKELLEYIGESSSALEILSTNRNMYQYLLNINPNLLTRINNTKKIKTNQIQEPLMSDNETIPEIEHELAESNDEATTETEPELAESDIETTTETATELAESDIETTTETATELAESDIEATTETEPELTESDIEAITETEPELTESDIETPTETEPESAESDIEATTETEPESAESDIEAITETEPESAESDIEATTETEPELANSNDKISTDTLKFADNNLNTETFSPFDFQKHENDLNINYNNSAFVLADNLSDMNIQFDIQSDNIQILNTESMPKPELVDNKDISDFESIQKIPDINDSSFQKQPTPKKPPDINKLKKPVLVKPSMALNIESSKNTSGAKSYYGNDSERKVQQIEEEKEAALKETLLFENVNPLFIKHFPDEITLLDLAEPDDRYINIQDSDEIKNIDLVDMVDNPETNPGNIPKAAQMPYIFNSKPIGNPFENKHELFNEMHETIHYKKKMQKTISTIVKILIFLLIICIFVFANGDFTFI